MIGVDTKLAGVEQRRLMRNEINNKKCIAVSDTALTGILY